MRSKTCDLDLIWWFALQPTIDLDLIWWFVFQRVPQLAGINSAWLGKVPSRVHSTIGFASHPPRHKLQISSCKCGLDLSETYGDDYETLKYI